MRRGTAAKPGPKDLIRPARESRGPTTRDGRSRPRLSASAALSPRSAKGLSPFSALFPRSAPGRAPTEGWSRSMVGSRLLTFTTRGIMPGTVRSMVAARGLEIGPAVLLWCSVRAWATTRWARQATESLALIAAPLSSFVRKPTRNSRVVLGHVSPLARRVRVCVRARQRSGA